MTDGVRDRGGSLTLRQPGRWLVGGVDGAVLVLWATLWLPPGRDVAGWEAGLRLSALMMLGLAAVATFANVAVHAGNKLIRSFDDEPGRSYQPLGGRLPAAR